MKWVNGYRMRLMLFVSVAAIVLGGGEPSNADFTFGTATNLGSAVNTSARDEEPGISADGLSIYFCSLRPGGYGGYDMWVTSRTTTQDDWGPPVNLGPTVNSSSDDFSEDISADSLELYFGSNRPGSSSYDIWVAKRASKQDDWTTPVNLGQMVNSSSEEGCPSISDDGLELYFWSTRPGGQGGYDIWVAKRETAQDEWGRAENLGPTVNSSTTELCTDVSPDGLSLIFVSARAGGYGGSLGDLWLTRRPTTNDPWGSPVNLGPVVNGSNDENGPCLSADGSMLYLSSNRPGGSGLQDMWQVPLRPVVDFNGDGTMDCEDVCVMVDHFREYHSPCDIAPVPFGDGIVDIRDLEVLLSYRVQPVDDPTLIAHWALDEAEGDIAYDSAGVNDAFVIGRPVWHPTGGRIGGAIELDGSDDWISAAAPANPSDGSFSVLVWVKGGAPGQAIISEPGGPDWLSLHAQTGHLMTELTSAGRNATALVSEAAISDEAWHRVGLVWDGLYRTLYVDGLVVAQDTKDSLQNPGNGFYVGTGKAMMPGTFFSGLIDDVRIYNRTVRP